MVQLFKILLKVCSPTFLFLFDLLTMLVSLSDWTDSPCSSHPPPSFSFSNSISIFWAPQIFPLSTLSLIFSSQLATYFTRSRPFIFCSLIHCLVSLPPPFLFSLHSFYSLLPVHCLQGPASCSTLGRDLMMQKCSSALQELHDAPCEQKEAHTQWYKNTNTGTHTNMHTQAQLQRCNC